MINCAFFSADQMHLRCARFMTCRVLVECIHCKSAVVYTVRNTVAGSDVASEDSDCNARIEDFHHAMVSGLM